MSICSASTRHALSISRSLAHRCERRILPAMGGPTSTDDNKALVRRFYAALDRGDCDAMDELVAEDYLNHAPPPFPGDWQGREGLKRAIRLFWEATPGHHELEEQIAEGDKVVTRLVGRGRFERELAGIPPNGEELHTGAIAIHRIEDGRIVEHWAEKDTLGLLQQMGVIPRPAAPPSEREATLPAR